MPPPTELLAAASCNGILLKLPTAPTADPVVLDFAQYLAGTILLIWQIYSAKRECERVFSVLFPGGAAGGTLWAGPPLLEEDMREKAMV